MQPSSVHHINFLCKDLDASCLWLETLLNQPAQRGELVDRAVATARFKLGSTWLVLVQPKSAESTVGQILKQRGEGLFLISLEVDDLEKYIDELGHKGISMDHGGPRKGLDNWLVQDVEAPACFGPVLQLCQSMSKK